MMNYKTPRRQSMDYPMAESSFDDSRHNSIDSRTGSKRLYSNRNVRPTILGDNGKGESALGPPFDNDDDEYPDEKRHRFENWPLPPAPIEQVVAPPSRAPSRANSQASRRSRKSTASPQPRLSLQRSRPSRFMEGSMNDKVSHIPPTPYLYHEEELRERYIEDALLGNNGTTSPGRKIAKPRGFMHHSNKSIGGESSLAGASDISRQSTIFRFGSKIAASIKPSNWKMFSKAPKVPEETPQQRDIRERQEKAEKMYHELKANGFFRDGAIIQQPGFNHLRHSMDQTPRFKHDSGVELNNKYHSRDNTPTGERSQSRLNAPDSYHDSPASKFSAPVDTSTPRSLFHRKTPSMSNLRNMTSREWMARPALLEGPQSVRKIPSRKDFQKQQKLVKRVSDLENKLDEARRQLTDTFVEPLSEEQRYQPPDFQVQPPYQQSYRASPLYQKQAYHAPPSDRYGRSRFVPGALATLPSERLLSSYVDPRTSFHNNENFNNIGTAITTQDSMDHVSTEPTDLFKTSQIRNLQPTQQTGTMQEEGSEYVLSSIESESEMSDSHHSQSIVTSGSANGAKAVEVKSTSSRIMSQQADIEDERALTSTTKQARVIKKKRSDQNDGTFRPTPESDSDSNSGPDINAKPLRKVRSSRTRKFINEKSPYTGPSTPPKRDVSDNGRKTTVRTAPVNEAEGPRSILVKLKIPKDSPPAKNNSDTFSYAKTRKLPAQQFQDEDAAPDQEASPAYGHYGAPPVPTRFPQHVRVPSDELLNTRASRAQRFESTQTTNEPGDWPDDLEIF